METKSSLVRADRAVELYAVAVVDLHLAVVIDPRDTEQDRALRRRQPLQESLFPVLLLIRFDHDAEGFQNFLHCLKKFRLIGILSCNSCKDVIYIRHGVSSFRMGY